MKCEILKVKFIVSYDYDTEKQEYKAVIKIILPVIECGLENWLHKAFRNSNKKLLDETLTENWGYHYGEFESDEIDEDEEKYVVKGRQQYIELRNSNLDELKERVYENIENYKKLITEVVNENSKKIEELPCEQVEELVLFYPIVK